MSAGALQTLESDLQHKAKVTLGSNRANRAETIDGVVAHELVQLLQLLVGKAEVGLRPPEVSAPSSVQTPKV